VSDEQRRFREAIGRFATGVTVVTTRGAAGPAGLTTNAVTSLSLDPLLLVVCFDNASRTLPVVLEARRFAVNVLHTGQTALAQVFASKRVATEKFEAVTHSEASGVPVLDDALAWFACELREVHPGGDHTIGIGEIVEMGGGPDAEPLVFYRGLYTTVR
jgi:flavin reductase (DIM6/NTAB) family NADH-FMN oxidoreductase RutF